MKRVLIPLWKDDVAPRFDLASEALVVLLGSDRQILERRLMVLPQVSAEALCDFIARERIDLVVCCAIEEQFYQYLTWKKVTVLDSVAGPADKVLERVVQGTIQSGDFLSP